MDPGETVDLSEDRDECEATLTRLLQPGTYWMVRYNPATGTAFSYLGIVARSGDHILGYRYLLPGNDLGVVNNGMSLLNFAFALAGTTLARIAEQDFEEACLIHLITR
jgi:hypothetical protein